MAEVKVPGGTVVGFVGEAKPEEKTEPKPEKKPAKKKAEK